MKSVIVSYQVRAEFAETNAANIKAVMAELRGWNDAEIRYRAYRKADGVTFVHQGSYANEAALGRAQQSPAFKQFQQELRASKPVSPPQADWLDAVGSSYDVFG